jgi:hypothetical protein
MQHDTQTPTRRNIQPMRSSGPTVQLDQSEMRVLGMPLRPLSEPRSAVFTAM